MEGRPKLHCSILILVILCLMLNRKSSAEKVLMVPRPQYDSHWMVEASIGQAFVDRGHTVTVVVGEDIVAKRRAERPDFTFETFPDDGEVMRLIKQASKQTEKTWDWKYCEHLLGKDGQDSDLMGRLKTAQYGVVISDSLLRCGTIVAANLGTPHVVNSPDGGKFIDKLATGVPLPLAYVATAESPFTDKMTYLQRVENACFYFGFVSIFKSWSFANEFDDLVHKYVSEKETIHSLRSRTDLWLYHTDTVLGFPRPSMPNMVQVGGLMADRPVVPLSVILGGCPNHTKTGWRADGRPPRRPSLRAHPKTRAFVTHVGKNGMYEALYHGVPMVCFPLFGNAARVVDRGLGVSLDFRTVTSDQLYHALLRVLTNNSYHETAARLSRLHRDQPQSPMERAVWWIEHVIKHGGLPHLRARAVELPWYQYYLLDVAAFLLGICSAVLGTLWYSCSFVCRKVCCKRGGKLKSQ
uniref:UDP-glucuronosyltransferase n=1 Tax=Branchiostoma floridae TaxID=7739 RepID=C3Z843_BRAFL|eukprot:XP_002595345.1 hypothetical protein BRAFLDRAFT_59784 [Branchiostoma floridae]